MKKEIQALINSDRGYLRINSTVTLHRWTESAVGEKVDKLEAIVHFPSVPDEVVELSSRTYPEIINEVALAVMDAYNSVGERLYSEIKNGHVSLEIVTTEDSQWYVVCSEHADEWFGFERPSPVSRDEIARLATEWDTPIDTLMEQVSDSARIVRVNPDGSRDHTLSADYSTLNYSIPELFDIARAWEDEDGDGTQYVVEGC